MFIKKCQLKTMFNQFNVKYVTDIDLNVNGSKCLKGFYSQSFKFQEFQTDIFLNEYEYKVIYIYGQVLPFNEKNNFHLALAYKKNSVVEINTNQIHIVIENAAQINFSDNSINLNHPKAKYKTYFNCKMWQFANLFFRILK